MEKLKKRLLRALVVILILGAVLTAVSHFVFHRSVPATIVAMGIRIANNGETYSRENADIAMERKAEDEDIPVEIDTEGFECDASLLNVNGSTVLTLGNKGDTEDTILYLHGGAYVNNINAFHLDFLDRMAAATKAYIVVPLYPLAPNHIFEETYRLLDEIYPGLRSADRWLTIMGDSAGGGLALAYSEYLAVQGEKMPDEIIVFSPWVDITMEANDHSEYEPLDPMLEVPGCIEMGRAWAGDTDTRDYRLSPLFGECSKLPKTTLFVGTNEILFPDVLDMYEKMKAEGVDAVLYIGEGMNHIYPLYPVVPESVEAAEQVFEMIRE